MATRKEKNIETVDAVQWDGLKETALAFFGMPVYEVEENSGCAYFFDHKDLWYKSGFDDQLVPIGWYLVKDANGEVLDMCPEEFNRQYEIIDEYPA